MLNTAKSVTPINKFVRNVKNQDSFITITVITIVQKVLSKLVITLVKPALNIVTNVKMLIHVSTVRKTTY